MTSTTSWQNRANAAWLREQIEDLADHLTLSSSPCSMDEARSRLLSIARGEDWRIDAHQRHQRRAR